MTIEKPRFLTQSNSADQGDPAMIAALALQVVVNGKIQLSRAHVSRVHDQGTARSNTVHQMFELAAQRSHYENAPGGKVQLDARMLRTLVELSRYYSFTVSEIAGGSHSKSSIHYRGVAFDVNVINGVRVSAQHPDCARFMSDCRQLGATEIIGPPQPGHGTHVHVGWR